MSKFILFKTAAIIAVLLATVHIAVAGDAMKQDRCYKDWSEAARVVSDQNLVSVATLSQQFRRQKLGEIIKTELCRSGDNYVYRLVIRTAKGRFSAATYDARRGIEIGIAGQHD